MCPEWLIPVLEPRQRPPTALTASTGIPPTQAFAHSDNTCTRVVSGPTPGPAVETTCAWCGHGRGGSGRGLLPPGGDLSDLVCREVGQGCRRSTGLVRTVGRPRAGNRRSSHSCARVVSFRSGAPCRFAACAESVQARHERARDAQASERRCVCDVGIRRVPRLGLHLASHLHFPQSFTPSHLNALVLTRTSQEKHPPGDAPTTSPARRRRRARGPLVRRVGVVPRRATPDGLPPGRLVVALSRTELLQGASRPSIRLPSHRRSGELTEQSPPLSPAADGPDPRRVLRLRDGRECQ